jgi:HEAT repeat protein
MKVFNDDHQGISNVTTKRIVEYHIGRLQDKDPNVRLKSIHELALLGDADTLEALQAVYQNDADERVRKAAQEAGRTIFLKQREQGVK